MRSLLVVASLAIACTSEPPPAPADSKPAAEPPAAAPATTTPAPVTPPVAAPTTPAVPAPEPEPAAPTLLAGPDRYQLPKRVYCPDEEPGPFCGVYILDVAGAPPITLLTRDGTAWFVRDGKTETPTTVEFVKMPRPPELLARFDVPRSDAGATFILRKPHPLVPESFALADVRGFQGDFVVLGDKLYGAGLVKDTALLQIDPSTKSFVKLDLGDKTPLEVLPAGPNLALYLSGPRKKTVATFDVAARKIARELEIPRDLEPECKRTRHYYGEDEMYFVPATGRFYVGFSCFPDA
ncbi:hypothetical protein [Nannocystis punicea]|uniref:Uncharacterized protein n=1 Tax=Nannocystis punicea TaxID=2995304 RepID=A0ABY7H8I2_9BACT|nr:hypothetical protein [Nannocystis poenicansa]WAS95578.1 hypothetical protein O0S08_05400 [Nannocystis poenicansa]